MAKKIRNNPFKPLIRQIPAPIRNRYFLVLVFFFAWLIFFDKHNVWTQYQLQQSLDKLKSDKIFYEEKIVEVREAAKDIALNKEKFAREKYYMKKKNEDVFVIVREEE
ncbi:MAG: septum formation initiator family protein [Saprospiraceae bacterium]